MAWYLKPSESPGFETEQSQSPWGRGRARFTDCRCLEVRGQEDGCEAEEGSEAGGVPAAALAVPVEDVDLGRLEVEAGVDPNHGAGPGGEGRAAAVTWGAGGEQMGGEYAKLSLEGEAVCGMVGREDPSC